MLAKMERAYLGLLRVVILIAATIALVVAGIAAISAIPPLLRWTGITETADPNGGTLAEFIDEQKITTTTSSEPTTESTEEYQPFAFDDIKTASKIVKRYLGKRGTASEADWRTGFQTNANSLEGHGLDYATSVKSLAEQLESSKGKPLSEERVVQLFGWHKTKFEADIIGRASREAEGNAKFWVTIGLAGSAFVAFIMIIFVFLFVRIERNLRLVQTTRVGPTVAETANDADLRNA